MTGTELAAEAIKRADESNHEVAVSLLAGCKYRCGWHRLKDRGCVCDQLALADSDRVCRRCRGFKYLRKCGRCVACRSER